MPVFERISKLMGGGKVGGMMLALLVVALFGARAKGAEIPDAEIQNRRCVTCHGESSIASLPFGQRMEMLSLQGRPASGPAAIPELYVKRDALQPSVHKGLACVSCHPDANTLPHTASMAKPTCDSGPSCHAKQESLYLQGSHAEAAAKGEKNVPTCVTCHGGHDILPKTDRNSKSFPLNVVKTCGNCHEKHMGKTPNGSDAGGQVDKYLESVHGQAVVKAGLTVSATCADCHGEHDVHPSSDKRSPVNRVNVPETCGKCHVGIIEAYSKSVHGELLASGNKQAPVCSDCHTAHEISRTDSPAFMRDIVNECGSCHDKPKEGSREKASLYETYRASYHGQVTALASGAETRAARCSDCHGAHNIRRVDDPNSPLNDQNRLATCQKCHKGAKPNFASFAPHADFRNSDRYPILHYVYLYFVVMMSASFGFFGMHCVLWFGRSVIERLRKGPGSVHPKVDYSKGAIQRFNRVDRVNHGLVIVTFFGLALTGLPLLYSEKLWAQDVAAIFGGARACGIMHRIFAATLIGNFVVHAVGVVGRILKPGLEKKYGNRAPEIYRRMLWCGAAMAPAYLVMGVLFEWGSALISAIALCLMGAIPLTILVLILMDLPVVMPGLKQMLFGPTTMLPTKKDMLDCLGMFRWFFVGGQKPKFDRWTYWEKFDYTAEVGGSMIIGISGLFLWFPVFFSNYLPGWMFNVATIVHGFEALLAVGFIFTIHFFNAHLRLEKFPVDDVIFTGRMTEAEYKHERGAEYDRMVASGEIEKLRVAAPRAWYRNFAVFMGISAMTVGTIIVALIILAALKII